MTEREAFIEAIAANPADEAGRLAFADWMQENGEEDRAEFVRLAYEIAVRRREQASSHPLSDNAHELWERANELFQLRGSYWLEPFYRALNAEETPPAQAPNRWRSRLWQRLAGEPRSTRYVVNGFQGDYAQLDCWGDGPVRELSLSLGFVEHLHLSLESPFLIHNLEGAFRQEPVQRLAFHIGPSAKQWTRLNKPSLRRVNFLGLTLPNTHQRKVAATFDLVLHGGNWSGLHDLFLWSPNTEPRGIQSEYIRQLACSPLLSQLPSLHAEINVTSLPHLTRSSQATKLRSLNLWMCDLPPEAGKIIGGATFRPNLEKLELPQNHIDGNGVRELASVAWPKLRSLDLGCNELADAGVQNLLPLVPQLTDLWLSSNAITDAGALALADAIDPKKMENFSLSYNPLSPGTVEALRARFGSRFHFRTEADDRSRSY